jgi:hypothetical protein
MNLDTAAARSRKVAAIPTGTDFWCPGVVGLMVKCRTPSRATHHATETWMMVGA